MFNCTYKYNLYSFIFILLLFSCGDDDSSTTSPTTIPIYESDQSFIVAMQDVNNLQDITYFNERIEFDSDLYFGEKRIKKIDFSSYIDNDNNTIDVIPEEIGGLKALVEINLSNNVIDSINSSICEIVDTDSTMLELGKINLSKNNLCDISKVPSCLVPEITFGDGDQDQSCYVTPFQKDLDFLTLVSNDNSIDLQNVLSGAVWVDMYDVESNIIVQRVQSLDLDGLGISTLDDSIEDLEYLEDLELNDNELIEIPDNIAMLTNLKYLDVSDNLISSLPPTIGDLKQLETLRIGENNLTSLRSEIGDLESLTTLRAADNQITSISQNLGNLTNLSTFWVHNNNIDYLSDNLCPIVESGSAQILLSNNCFKSPCTDSDGEEVLINESMPTQDECMCIENDHEFNDSNNQCLDAEGSVGATSSNTWEDPLFPSCFYPYINLFEQKPTCE